MEAGEKPKQGPQSENGTKSRKRNVKPRPTSGETFDEKNEQKEKIGRADRSKKITWPTREFTLRNSYLTEAFKNFDIRCIHHVGYITWAMWMIRLIVVDYSKKMIIQIPGITTLKQAFGGIQYWLFSHIIFLILALILCAGLQFWHWTRKLLNQTSKMFDSLSALALVFYMSALLFVPWYWVLFLSAQGAFVKEWIIAEQVRVCMKIIAFVSTKVWHALEETRAKENVAKNKDDQRIDNAAPSLSKFLYFLYAPTLVYSDEYPRNDRIRWSFVLQNFFDLLLILHVGFVIFEKELQASVLSYLLNQEPRTFILLMFETSLPFVTLLVLAMIGLWHSMQNLFGEILRFGDRQFYSDWWNEGTAAGFHRSNNIVVQDWLHHYIYYPVKKQTGSKFSAQMMVLFISAVVHDIMIGLALGFGLPIVSSNFLFMAFLLRFMKTDRRRDAWSNFKYLLGFPYGASFMGCFLVAEHFARQECQRTIAYRLLMSQTRNNNSQRIFPESGCKARDAQF